MIRCASSPRRPIAYACECVAAVKHEQLATLLILREQRADSVSSACEDERRNPDVYGDKR